MEHWAFYYNEGIALKEAHDYERSAACHLKVLEMEPDLEMPEAWHNAGAALLRIGRKEESEKYLKRAVILYDQLVSAIREVDLLELDEAAHRLLYGDEDEDGEAENWFDPEDEADMEIDNSYLFGEEPVAYYLFWKACCQALLDDRNGMIDSLRESIAEDDWFALEANDEEDLRKYRDDPELRSIVDPVVARINAPEHRHLYEIFEWIERKILIGFEDPAEFSEDVIEEVERREWPDPVPYSWIRKTVRDLHRKRLETAESWEHPTDVEKLADAFNELLKDGILALHNTGYSQLEAIDEVKSVMNDMVLSPDQMRGFCFYSGENVDELIYRENGTLHITFNNILLDDLQEGIDVGTIITARLRAKGFDVQWDGTMKTRVDIRNFSWKKVFVSDEDQQKWDHWRVFDLF